MNQLIAIAIGGAIGAIFRYLVSTGIYQWLGRAFPYGTLTVNIIGSFLLGLLTEALIVQRISFAHDYRHAILIGFIGAFTTFSTFSLETIYLVEQGQLSKALLNITLSVLACLLAVWLGLLCSRGLFYGTQGLLTLGGWQIPYALLVVNFIGAFMIGFVAALVLGKVGLPEASALTLMAVSVGLFLIFSGLYLVLYLLEQGYGLKDQAGYLMTVYAFNTFSCLMLTWLGFAAAKDL